MEDQATFVNQSEQPIDRVVDGLPRDVRLPAVAQTAWSIFGMDSFVRFCLKRYPDESMLAFRILGLGNVVSVLDPQLIREVFSADSDVLRGGELNAQIFGVLGPNSLLLLDGERHLRTRRLLLGPFHGQEIARHVELIEQIAAAEVERWRLGREFALWPRMRAITMEVILRTVIGVRDEPRCRELSEMLPAFVRAGPFGTLAETRMPWLTRGRIGGRLPWVRERAQAERLLYEEIAAHRADPDGREDVLAMLIAARDEDGQELSDEALRDHLLTLLGAGHDTTAAGLAWCFERVLRHPDVVARCRQASIDNDDEYLTAVVYETLRVRPVADAAARKLSAPLELGGYRLPAGTIVAASINGVQHSPKVYPDPARFSPERFLGERPAPYTLIPFGGGERRCIGASFAMMEIKTVLRTVLRQIELRPANPRDERASRTRSAATVPAHGTRVIATARMAP
jgi:cytochrome P450 family 135